MRNFFQMTFIGLLCAWWSTAEAEVTIIPGWSYSQSENGIVMSTPCGGGADMMVYGIYPAYLTNTDSHTDWLNAQVFKLTSGWTGFRGSVLNRSEIAQQGPVLSQTVDFTDGNGTRWSALIMGAVVGVRGQLYSVVTKSDADQSDPRFQAVIGNAIALAGQNFLLEPASVAQIPVRNVDAAGAFGSISFGMQTSKLRWFAQHRVDPAPQTLIVTENGQFFEGQTASAYSLRGTLRRVGEGPNATYELRYNDGTLDIVPASCALSGPNGGTGDATSGAPAAASGAPTPSAQSTCRTVVKEVVTTQVQTQCDYTGRCTQFSVPSIRKENVTVCD